MKKNNVRKITGIGVLAGISILLIAFIHVPLFPAVPFLEYDPADVPIFIGAFAFGPVSGFILTVIVSLIQGFLFGGNGIIGVLMHILATGIFTIVAGNIYKHQRNKNGALKATLIGLTAWIGSMALWNILVTPIYMGIDYDTLWSVYPWIILFNVIKAGLNGTLTMVLYKYMGKTLEKIGGIQIRDDKQLSDFKGNTSNDEKKD